jgi:3-isopropylmalate/(R)-2-methylmalate dehydratase small subunit
MMITEPFETLSSKAALLLVDDVDTDQIIPARFLTTTARVGLGAHLFADWRFDGKGVPRPDFALNQAEAAGARILVAGRNFGCGSSREHAPWALLDYGFRAVVAPSFADIFRGNALKNGLLPISVSEADHRELVAEVQRDPHASLNVDLAQQALAHPGGLRCTFPIDPFAKRCLLDGLDELGFLLAARDDIAKYERSHPAAVRTTA